MILVIDATGKPGSNIEGGNIVWLGSLSECLDIRAVDNTTKKYLFKGQYSIVVFVPPGPVRQVHNNRARWFLMKTFVIHQGIGRIINFGKCILIQCTIVKSLPNWPNLTDSSLSKFRKDYHLF